MRQRIRKPLATAKPINANIWEEHTKVVNKLIKAGFKGLHYQLPSSIKVIDTNHLLG